MVIIVKIYQKEHLRKIIAFIMLIQQYMIIIQIMNQFGYLGVCFLIAVENIFPPIPSEVILTFGGFMTTYTRLTVPGVIIFSTLGSTIGALVLYWAGTALNPERLETLTTSL